jgi:hypothetical protein
MWKLHVFFISSGKKYLGVAPREKAWKTTLFIFIPDINDDTFVRLYETEELDTVPSQSLKTRRVFPRF